MYIRQFVNEFGELTWSLVMVFPDNVNDKLLKVLVISSHLSARCVGLETLSTPNLTTISSKSLLSSVMSLTNSIVEVVLVAAVPPEAISCESGSRTTMYSIGTSAAILTLKFFWFLSILILKKKNVSINFDCQTNLLLLFDLGGLCLEVFWKPWMSINLFSVIQNIFLYDLAPKVL